MVTTGQPVASSVLLQCQLQRWKSAQLDMEPSPRPLLCRFIYWTGGLTRPGISVWTCSVSATLSAGSGGRSAVCKSYRRTLWCLHPVEQSRKSDKNNFILNPASIFLNFSDLSRQHNKKKKVCYYPWRLELLLNKIQFSFLAGARKSNHMQCASVGKNTGSTQERINTATGKHKAN